MNLRAYAAALMPGEQMWAKVTSTESALALDLAVDERIKSEMEKKDKYALMEDRVWKFHRGSLIWSWFEFGFFFLSFIALVSFGYQAVKEESNGGGASKAGAG